MQKPCIAKLQKNNNVFIRTKQNIVNICIFSKQTAFKPYSNNNARLLYCSKSGDRITYLFCTNPASSMQSQPFPQQKMPVKVEEIKKKDAPNTVGASLSIFQQRTFSLLQAKIF